MFVALLTFIFLLTATATTLNDLDSSYTELVQKLVSNINSYVEERGAAEIPIPPPRQITPAVELTNGRLGELNTFEVLETPEVSVSHNKNGTTSYTYSVVVGLNPLVVGFRYSLNLPHVETKGWVSFSPRRNAVELRGVVVVGAVSCSATLDAADWKTFGELRVIIEDESSYILPPDLDFQGGGWLQRSVMETFLTEGIPVKDFKTKFSEIVCNNFPL